MTIFPSSISSKKGYTLLFAVIVAMLLLSIAAFILSVSRKEFLLASSARDSIYSFYAADSGLECASENLSIFSTTSPPTSLTCGSQSLTITPSTPVNGAATSTFYMQAGAGGTGTETQSGASSCAQIQVGLWYSNGRQVTNIESRGYNIGWNSTKKDCSIVGPRKVERGLRLLYQ